MLQLLPVAASQRPIKVGAHFGSVEAVDASPDGQIFCATDRGDHFACFAKTRYTDSKYPKTPRGTEGL